MNSGQLCRTIWLTGVLAFTMNASAEVVEPNDKEIARVISKAAMFIYFSSFEQDPVTYAFSDDELEILSGHLEPLDLMIRDALGTRHSVGGAMLMAHFKLKTSMDYLRSHILEPGRTYGWEGSYESDEERFYSDGQYVYHSIYVNAFEDLAEAPIHDAIELNTREKANILRLASTQNHESYHWAIWLGRKLRIF